LRKYNDLQTSILVNFSTIELNFSTGKVAIRLFLKDLAD